MCHYPTESQKIINQLQPVSKMLKTIGPQAGGQLFRLIEHKRAFPGRDLADGRSLPDSCKAKGHYMTPYNYSSFLATSDRNPQRCQLCGRPLPGEVWRQHTAPHNHREHIFHHFHPQCWQAWMIAVAIIFNNLDYRKVLSAKPRRVAARKNKPLLIPALIELRLENIGRGGHGGWGRRGWK
ncbi:MAG: hypothetical protein KKE29_21425 [Proteobacteria bacterium]|nr:hypothetical protein [Pseudomonadota bacterium]MBU4577164.1 hypothetical protein [Pseudomonadota bacterium]MBU4599134.1 hypothetical protein [Pseudomonadota bacterium]